jgi:heme/copper-type cytochrome/quinol oxidase subunit 3
MHPTNIPYQIQIREDTGINNGRLAMWLFLASEILFFGALFSSYLLLRLGSDSWPRGSERLQVGSATINTLVLILSSVTMVRAWERARAGELKSSRLLLAATAGLGTVFAILKGLEWAAKLNHGIRPADDLFYALYFMFTGVHLLHLLAGVLVLGDLAVRGRRLESTQPGLLEHRVEIAGIYWHFVDLVWLVIFPVLYLT